MRRLFALLMAILLIGISSPTSFAARVDVTDYDIPNGHFYTQAVAPGTPAGYGHSITDSGADDRGQTILFWSEFKRLGGVATLGYPSSERFMLDGFWTQATQRVLLQWRPELKVVLFVNVFDTLHDIGRDRQLLDTKQVPVQVNDNGSCANSDFNCIKAYRLNWLDSNPAIKQYYLTSIADPVTYYGLPTSHIDTSNNAFDIVRLQRIVIQYWKVNAPGIATAGMITVGLGGDIAKEQGLVNVSASAPIPDPTKVSSQPPAPPVNGLPVFPQLGGVVFGDDFRNTAEKVEIINPQKIFNPGAVVAFIAYLRQPMIGDKLILNVYHTYEKDRPYLQGERYYSEVYTVTPGVNVVYSKLQFVGSLPPGYYTFELKSDQGVQATGQLYFNPSQCNIPCVPTPGY